MMGKANYLGLVGGGTSPKFPVNKVCLEAMVARLAVHADSKAAHTMGRI